MTPQQSLKQALAFRIRAREIVEYIDNTHVNLPPASKAGEDVIDRIIEAMKWAVEQKP